MTDPGPDRLQTRRTVRERGACHPTLVVESLDRGTLGGGDGGRRPTENARLSPLLSPDT